MKRELWPESRAMREAEAKIGPADIAECMQRIENLKASGSVASEEGLVVVVSAGKTKTMLKAAKAKG